MAGLLDFIQGASNAAAGTVAGPVDLINMGLLSVGLPMPANPVGGSQWMRERGLMREPQNRVAGLLGEAAGNVLPIVAAAKAPQIAQGLLNHADAYRKYHAATTAPGAPATVWHGSPHRFDKFDSSKIGTGEGAQAYGHGLYFAENPAVAQEYQRTLSKYAPQIDGKSVFESYADGTLVSQLVSKAGLSRGNAVEASHWLGEAARTNRPLSEIVEENAARSLRLLGNADEAARIRALGAKVAGVSQGGTVGHLYKVDLPDDAIARMLNWDAPLSKQPEAVRGVLSGNEAVTSYMAKANAERAALNQSHPGRLTHPVLGKIAGKAVDETTVKAQTAYEQLVRQYGEQGAAKLLREAGVPGIRYLDGGSRTAGDGTRNFVVFPGNEGLLTILGRE